MAESSPPRRIGVGNFAGEYSDMDLSSQDATVDLPDIEEIMRHNHSATYCPEDNKLRFYPDWADGDFDKEKLKAAGYRWASKQDCYVCPRWTTTAEDAALQYVDEIDDEDYSPQERAADRAERFSGYRNKRSAEAHGIADRYDAGPTVFGSQNARRAERQAARHDRLRGRACSRWNKAEYWQMRTSGVISNALHRSQPSVRRGRILEIEKEIRTIEASYTPSDDKRIMDTDWRAEDGGVLHEKAWCGKGRGGRWVRVDHLESIKAGWARHIAHLNMRLIYENAMLENEGGKVTEAEIIPGGFINGRQVWKVNKSAATGRVTSVAFSATGSPRNIERLGADAYRAPTEAELAEFNAKRAAVKAEAKANGTATPPLLNPTPETAQVLVDLWNATSKPGEQRGIQYVTQAQYSAASKGDYARCKTVSITERGLEYYSSYNGIEWCGHRTVFRLRVVDSGSGRGRNILILSDKPQKPLPLGLLTQTGPNPPEYLEAIESLPLLEEARHGKNWFKDMDEETRHLWKRAASWGLTTYASESQFGITEKGEQLLKTLAAVE